MPKRITCRWLSKNMVAYIDGQLPKEQWPFIERHLRECPSCLEKVGNIEYAIYELSLPRYPRGQASVPGQTSPSGQASPPGEACVPKQVSPREQTCPPEQGKPSKQAKSPQPKAIMEECRESFKEQIKEEEAKREGPPPKLTLRQRIALSRKSICKRLYDKRVYYVFDDLSPQERFLFQEHLKTGCAHCLITFEATRRDMEGVVDEPTPEIPEPDPDFERWNAELWEKIRQSEAEDKARKRARIKRLLSPRFIFSRFLLLFRKKECRWVINRISDYLDNELYRIEDVLLAKHLKECPRCMLEYKEQKYYKMLLTTPEGMAIIEEHKQKIEKQKSERRQKAERRGFLPKIFFPRLIFPKPFPWPVAAVAVILLAVGAGLFFQRSTIFQKAVSTSSVIGKFKMRAFHPSIDARYSSQSFRLGEEIKTDAFHKATLLFDEGHLIRINHNTTLKVERYIKDGVDKGYLIKLFQGEIWVEVKHNKKKEFWVETETAKMKSLGTKFNIKVLSNKETVLTTTEGEVLLVVDSTQRVVKAGYEAVARADGLLSLPYRVEASPHPHQRRAGSPIRRGGRPYLNTPLNPLLIEGITPLTPLDCPVKPGNDKMEEKGEGEIPPRPPLTKGGKTALPARGGQAAKSNLYKKQKEKANETHFLNLAATLFQFSFPRSLCEGNSFLIIEQEHNEQNLTAISQFPAIPAKELSDKRKLIIRLLRQVIASTRERDNETPDHYQGFSAFEKWLESYQTGRTDEEEKLWAMQMILFNHKASSYLQQTRMILSNYLKKEIAKLFPEKQRRHINIAADSYAKVAALAERIEEPTHRLISHIMKESPVSCSDSCVPCSEIIRVWGEEIKTGITEIIRQIYNEEKMAIAALEKVVVLGGGG